MAILIADTESTGLSDQDRVCEYAHMVVEVIDTGNGYEQLKVLEEFETLVNPGIPIPAQATAVHGIKDSDVAQASALSEILPAYLPKSLDLEIYGHNFCRFDMKFLHPHLPQQADIGCTLRAAKRWLPSSKSHSLDKLRVELELPKSLAHSALGDVHTTFHLVNHILSMGVPWSEVQAEMLRRIDTMPWGKYKGRPLEEVAADETYLKWLLEEAEATSWELRRALQEL